MGRNFATHMHATCLIMVRHWAEQAEQLPLHIDVLVLMFLLASGAAAAGAGAGFTVWISFFTADNFSAITLGVNAGWLAGKAPLKGYGVSGIKRVRGSTDPCHGHIPVSWSLQHPQTEDGLFLNTISRSPLTGFLLAALYFNIHEA